MILLGAFLELKKVVSVESVIESLRKVLAPEKHHLIELNKLALKKGASLVKVPAV
ncbi:2-oxoacid:acceptor oxidoreductase family protein [Bacillus sp. MRMR6]|uniref:2-oxoacid:acceptor oxidoreductase family protein n=1 Tax=Bacillus sp. MRMR6 TaxID=1928617 RepID=UPI0034C6B91F